MITEQSQLEKNYADSLKRLTNRYRSGMITEREYNRLLNWEGKITRAVEDYMQSV